jgi:hypothetical protein
MTEQIVKRGVRSHAMLLRQLFRLLPVLIGHCHQCRFVGNPAIACAWCEPITPHPRMPKRIRSINGYSSLPFMHGPSLIKKA